MNQPNILKNEINDKLSDLNEKDMGTVIEFIDFIRYKRQKLKPLKILKLQGILNDQNIDFSDLKKFRKETWEHLEKA